MRTTIILACIAVFFRGMNPARASEQSPEQLVDQLESRFKQLRSWQGHFTAIMNTEVPGTEKGVVGEIYHAYRDGRHLYRIKEKTVGEIQGEKYDKMFLKIKYNKVVQEISDGETIWYEYRGKEGHKVTQLKEPRLWTEYELSLLGFSKIREKITDTQLRPNASVRVLDGEYVRGDRHILLEFHDEGGKIIYSIHEESGIVTGVRTISTSEDEPVEIRFQVTELEVNEPIQDHIFQYTPPTGSGHVADLESQNENGT